MELCNFCSFFYQHKTALKDSLLKNSKNQGTLGMQSAKSSQGVGDDDDNMGTNPQDNLFSSTDTL